MLKKITLLSILLLLITTNTNKAIAENELQQNIDIFNTFNYSELVELSKTAEPTGELGEKLNRVLHTPIIDNSIASNDYTFKNDPKFNDFIRVASWNIARGMNCEKIKLIFNNSDKIKTMIKDKAEEKKIMSEVEALKNSDIIILNEVDSGMPRTGYKTIVQELAKAGGYNYAYGVEFVEVDPVHLGLEKIKWSEETFLKEKGILEKDFKVDKEKYKGLHGNAILSKFPLSNVRIYRLPKYYDWFKDEKARMSEIERIRRNVADKAFKEQVIREIRHGSRMAIIADVAVPNGDKITIVAAHFENRVVPSYRQKMLRELLSEISDVTNPLILAGDFNTTTQDGRPTSVTREVTKRIKDPNFVIRTALLYSNPISAVVNASTTSADMIRKQSDPTVHSIPVVAPNFERKFFNIIKKYEFDDKSKFDVSGTRERTISKVGLLSNSNQRKNKGFVPTYLFERNFYIARYKLDWIFVKTSVRDDDEDDENNRRNKFTPHYGRTLFNLNYGLNHNLADHAPITVDLPIEDYNTSH